MKYLPLLILSIAISNSCTFEKDEFADMHEDIIGFFGFSPSLADSTVFDYMIFAFSDTINLKEKNPDYTIKPWVPYYFENEFLRDGIWIIVRKWVDGDSYLYETDPHYYKLDSVFTPKRLALFFNYPVRLHQRKIISSVENIIFKDENPSPPDNIIDDAVSGPLPDYYFEIPGIIRSPEIFLIDWIADYTYSPSSPIYVPTGEKLEFNIFDYDFNCSQDDLMYSNEFIPLPKIVNQAWNYTNEFCDSRIIIRFY
jgi:hypothetical protein